MSLFLLISLMLALSSQNSLPKDTQKNLTAICKDGEEFCEDPDANYPTELISKLLDTKRVKRATQRRLPRQVIDPLQSEPVCGMRQYWARPRAATNNMGRILFIININGTETRREFVQEVEVGECYSPGESCGDGSVWPNLNTYCRQMYSKTQLYAVSESGQVVRDKFSFPSTCACWVGSQEL